MSSETYGPAIFVNADQQRMKASFIRFHVDLGCLIKETLASTQLASHTAEAGATFL